MSNRNKFARAPEVELRARFFSSNHNNFKSKLLFEFEVRVSDRGLPRLIADSTTKLSKKPIFFSCQIKFARALEVELQQF